MAAFFLAYPPFPWSGDDWHNMVIDRSILPNTRHWNPGRILPEFLSPLSGYIAAYVLVPVFSFDYIDAIIATVSSMVIVSAFLTICLAYKLFALLLADRLFACLMTGLFFICFFTGHKLSMPVGFPGTNLCIHLFYTIPNWLNFSLLLYMLHAQMAVAANPNHFLAGKATVQALNEHASYFALFVAASYLCMFSIMSANIIPAAYAGCFLFMDFTAAYKRGKGLAWNAGRFLRSFSFLRMMFLVILLLWAAAALYEMNGRRFADLNTHATATAAQAAVSTLKLAAGAISPRFFVILGALVLVTVLLAAAKKLTRRPDAYLPLTRNVGVTLTLSCAMVTIFNIMVTYVSMQLGLRATYGILCNLILLFCILFIYIIKTVPASKMLLPLTLLYFISYIWVSPPWGMRPRAEYNPHAPIIREWVAKARQADARGLDRLALYTPTTEWPHVQSRFGRFLSEIFFQHGITQRRLIIETSPEAPRGDDL